MRPLTGSSEPVYIKGEDGTLTLVTMPAYDWENTPQGKAYVDLLDRLTTGKTEPSLLVSKLVFNAQQDVASAKRMELGQRVVVLYREFQQDAVIAGMQYDIGPERWMITFTLARLQFLIYALPHGPQRNQVLHRHR